MREIKFKCWDNVLKYWLNEDDMPILLDGKNEILTFGNWENVRFCQYTGLKDKNGKEIYEGDIVQWDGWEVSRGKQNRPIRKRIVDWDYLRLFQLENLIDGNGTVEIIGNIYENSELLGE